ncbi:unnamed protein product [Phytomonas sp. EM1]|nr:unnamed protein product [Phytomonas sp. EM1]|eukprot:CCW60905.1 unnamed protein product [Phytomonas sp. isolate EM1]
MELIRLQTNLRLKSPGPALDVNDPESTFALYEFPTNFSSIGLMLSTVLSRVAIPRPVLKGLYTLAETLKGQAVREIRTGEVPKAFANATTHPIPSLCEPAKRRAMSIQRESTVNRNSLSLHLFITPILECVEEFMTLPREEASNVPVSESSPSISSGGVNSSTKPRRAVYAFPHSVVAVHSRATINQRNHEEVEHSPSPSAVRPGRR